MSSVINFPKNVVTMKRLYCDDCSQPLQYWLGTDDAAYGICPKCDLLIPDELTIDSNEGVQH
jgi:hypothetical protein